MDWTPNPAQQLPARAIGTGLMLRGGCIRLGAPGPALYTASNHAALGITAVGINASGDLVVTTDFGASEILVSAIVVPDFTLAVKRIFCGISGGGSTSTIRFTDADGIRRRADSSFFDIDIDNVWFQTVSIAS